MRIELSPMIGILIVSHGAFGESLIHSASHVLGKRPLFLRQSGVWIARNGRRVNAKSIMGVMMLAAGLGTTIELETDGVDEVAAIDAIEKLFADKFGEGE